MKNVHNVYGKIKVPKSAQNKSGDNNELLKKGWRNEVIKRKEKLRGSK